MMHTCVHALASTHATGMRVEKKKKPEIIFAHLRRIVVTGGVQRGVQPPLRSAEIFENGGLRCSLGASEV